MNELLFKKSHKNTLGSFLSSTKDVLLDEVGVVSFEDAVEMDSFEPDCINLL
jgi:hypothetical protein